MSAAHTPGPWTLDPENHSHVVSEDYHAIAAGCGFHGQEIEHREAGFSISGCISAADARLIAAVPDLLAAAVMALADCVDLISTPAGDALAAAIAKATGVTP